MPIYEYKCNKCDREFVAEHGIEEKKESCGQIDPACSSEGSISKKMYVPEKEKQNRERELTRDELAQRVHRGVEEMKENVSKEKKERMNISIDDLKGFK